MYGRALVLGCRGSKLDTFGDKFLIILILYLSRGYPFSLALVPCPCPCPSPRPNSRLSHHDRPQCEKNYFNPIFWEYHQKLPTTAEIHQGKSYQKFPLIENSLVKRNLLGLSAKKITINLILRDYHTRYSLTIILPEIPLIENSLLKKNSKKTPRYRAKLTLLS